jgi:predicted Kef-type K+ transport protein
MRLALLALDVAIPPVSWRSRRTGRREAFWFSLYFLALDVGENCVPLFPIALWAGVQDVIDQ